MNRPEAALSAYGRLSRETAVSPSEVPYALLAGGGARCQLLAATGKPDSAASEAEQLIASLLEGRRPLRRETFEYYWTKANQFLHTREDPPNAPLEFATDVSHLYVQWRPAAKIGANSTGGDWKALAKIDKSLASSNLYFRRRSFDGTTRTGVVAAGELRPHSTQAVRTHVDL